MGNIKSTLLELVTHNFSEINKKRRLNKKNNKKTKTKFIHNSTFSISTILMNSTIRESKNKEKESKEEDLEETAEEEQEDKNKVIVNSGYGTINKHYGMSSVAKYADYNKIWGHLGSFKTYNMHWNNESSNNITIKNGESSREMVSMGTLDKAAKHFKYFVGGELLGEVGLAPPVGSDINSKDWEKYRLMTFMSIYKPLLKLMHSTA